MPPTAPAPASTLPRAVTCAVVRGIPIRIHLSWVLIAGLVTWLFFLRFSALLGAESTLMIGAAAALLAGVFFASILLHELAHALVSLVRGIPVAGITLFLLGGVTESTAEPRRARDEVLIVGAGPLASLLLAVTFAVVAAALPGATVAGVVAVHAAWLNLALAIFNALPAYPLDGGRLLRALLWAVTGDPHRALRGAARVGQGFALLLILGGGYGLLGGPLPATDGALRWAVALLAAGGLWGLLIGLFLLRGANEAVAVAQARVVGAARPVAAVMGALPGVLSAATPVAEARRLLAAAPTVCWPVLDPFDGDRVVGTVCLDDLLTPSVAADAPLRRYTHDGSATTVPHDLPLERARERLAGAPAGTLVVTRHGTPVGLLTPSLLGGLWQ